MDKELTVAELREAVEQLKKADQLLPKHGTVSMPLELWLELNKIANALDPDRKLPCQ